tara:strand:+ start:955 stop:1101 length:147 start_codon:yes stop_codon:yes gene_type:complete
MTKTDCIFLLIIIVPMVLGSLAVGISILKDTIEYWGEDDEDFKKRNGY